MEKNSMGKAVYRGGFYATGLIVMALGITINTKTGLGVSPVATLPFCISVIWNLSFGNAAMIVYLFCISIELVLHSISKGRIKSSDGSITAPRNLKAVLVMDLLQLPLSLAFTRVLNFFGMIVPDFQTVCAYSFMIRCTMLIAGIILTGIGVAMSLDMRLIASASDGIVQVIADFAGKNVGFIKNCFDVTNMVITIIISLIFTGHFIGIGIGTVLAAVGIGRVIAVFNSLFATKMKRLAGM